MLVLHRCPTWLLPAALAGLGMLLVVLALMTGSYWAIALAMYGFKAGPSVARFWIGAMLAAGSGGALLVTALRWPAPSKR